MPSPDKTHIEILPDAKETGALKKELVNSVAILTSYAGQSVNLRFRLGTDSSVNREGWYIDDVVVQSCQAAC